MKGVRHALQEVRELGTGGTLFRLQWESRMRLAGHWPARLQEKPPPALPAMPAEGWLARLPFEDADVLGESLRDRIPAAQRRRLSEAAERAAGGEVPMFSRWSADFGRPIDWHREPRSGRRWPSEVPWQRALAGSDSLGDIKLCWEAARFPHAYLMARAAVAAEPETQQRWATALQEQIVSFRQASVFGQGVHWVSGQELTVRSMAWLFALDTLLSRTPGNQKAAEAVAQALHEGAWQLQRVIGYARYAIYNNHALADALGLYLAGILLPGSAQTRAWRQLGRSVLEEQIAKQFYADGGYIQLSHNYHRTALDLLLWATLFARTAGEPPGEAWLQAMDRSLHFLSMHQNPSDGSLPNYGANDGSLPSLLSGCAFPDFRCVLQAVAVAVRGERLFEAGPWDERAAWLCGVRSLDLPLRPRRRRTSAFVKTGFYVLRGRSPQNFLCFRCGDVRDRFGQIDMLHADVWWRGHNVAVDGGSYLYSGEPAWHRHFVGSASHNTVTVDGHDQMVMLRKFKFLYRTRARALAEPKNQALAICAGEHDGYRRLPGDCVHRRSVALVDDDLFLIVDQVVGVGEHDLRLHWLFGDFPHRVIGHRLQLTTPAGEFSAAVFDLAATPLPIDVACGQISPPRGWLSRHYGEKVPVPSLAVQHRGPLPHTWITVLGPGEVALERGGDAFTARCAGQHARFSVRDGLLFPDR